MNDPRQPLPLQPQAPQGGNAVARSPEELLAMLAAQPGAPSPQLLVIRGLPGSGKSTLARALHTRHGFVHLEADTHFETARGYRFDPARASDAHAWVTREAYAALVAGQRVVVANTHVRLWELAQPLGLAALLSVCAVVVECEGAWDNIHGVPSEVLAAMRSKWEALPAHVACVRYCGTA